MAENLASQRFPLLDRRVDFRADGGRDLGFGHVMRCLTLGALLVDAGATVTLVSADIDPFLAERSRACGVGLEMIRHRAGDEADAAAAAERHPDLLVVDGYQFGESYFRHLDERGVRYMIIDDLGFDYEASALIVLNQNLHARDSMYPRVPAERLLLGLDFALIRGEILDARKRATARPQCRRPSVLIAIGGTDILDLATRIADQLILTIDADVVVAGPGGIPGASVAPPDIAEALASSTVAVIGAGSTMWEALFLGTPTVSLIVADNQAGSAHAVREASLGAVHDCRHGADEVDTIAESIVAVLAQVGSRVERSGRSEALVDGCGARRVVAAIQGAMAS